MSITLIHPAPDSGWAGQRLDGIIKQALPGREVRTVNRAEELSGLADGKVYQITAPKEQDQQIREKYICLNISHLRGGMEYRVLSDAPPEEPWEVRQPSLEDGYMYLLRSQEMGWTAGKAEGRQITNIEKAETDGAQVTKIEKAEACGPRIPKIEKARACGAGTCGEQCSDRGGADL